eukprot:COSAG01_NODE_882_length_12931_cov_668.084788_5_plen_128_part_00
MWIWVLGIELDIFIIGVNPTRDSRKIQGEFLEASTRFRKHRIQCCLLHAWSQAAWPAVVVRRPTLCIGDNRNARDWANEKVISEGNQHLDRHYFTIRERVRSGEILPIWIEGKNNPADVLTKAIRQS